MWVGDSTRLKDSYSINETEGKSMVGWDGKGPGWMKKGEVKREVVKKILDFLPTVHFFK